MILYFLVLLASIIAIYSDTIHNRILGIDVLYGRALQYKHAGLYSFALADMDRIQSIYQKHDGKTLGMLINHAIRSAFVERSDGMIKVRNYYDMLMQVHSLLGNYDEAISACTLTMHVTFLFLCIFLSR